MVKKGKLANGKDFKWEITFVTTFEIRKNGPHFVKNHLKSGQKHTNF